MGVGKPVLRRIQEYSLGLDDVFVQSFDELQVGHGFTSFTAGLLGSVLELRESAFQDAFQLSRGDGTGYTRLGHDL